MRRANVNSDKQHKFFVSAEYDFETKIWKSWYFEIEENQWQDSNTTEYRFPILGFRT